MKTDVLEAGRELDALVAQKVMGWPLHIKCFSCCEENPSHAHTGLRVPNYSTDIAAAMELVKKLGSPVRLYWDCDEWHFEMYSDGITRAYGCASGFDGAPLAICRAALKAMKEINA